MRDPFQLPRVNDSGKESDEERFYQFLDSGCIKLRLVQCFLQGVELARIFSWIDKRATQHSFVRKTNPARLNLVPWRDHVI